MSVRCRWYFGFYGGKVILDGGFDESISRLSIKLLGSLVGEVCVCVCQSIGWVIWIIVSMLFIYCLCSCVCVCVRVQVPHMWK